MDYVIKDASIEHVPQIEALEQQCFSSPWTAEQIKSQLKNGQHEFIAALSGEKLLGYVGMMYVLDEGYIANVAVSDEHRQLGIGDALIARLMETANELKLSFVTLEVRASNAPAIALYSKHGFSPVGRRKNYYDLPKEDAILMTKFLNRGTELENTCI